MKNPTCPKCPSTKFQYETITLWNGPETRVIACEECGAILAVFDPDTALIAKKLEI
jgi:RNA polymerase subunit RPABC4/transcription elongation factor Spt4